MEKCTPQKRIFYRDFELSPIEDFEKVVNNLKIISKKEIFSEYYKNISFLIAWEITFE